MGGSEVSKKVRLFFSSSNQFAFGIRMGHKVKALRERLDEIAAEKTKFHLDERSGVGSSFLPKERYQTHSSPPQVVIGREHDKEEIVRLLLSSDCGENVSVVPIVGIGGLGKTTLAQMVYNDERVKNHFELKMWVCVSDDFDVQLLVKHVIESASGRTIQSAQMDLLKRRLHEHINGRRYLLVLDDVWNVDVDKWLSFKDLLIGGAKGSKIVITTRLRKVAEISRPIFTHHLTGLSEHEAWSLFKQMAFKQQQPPNSSLEDMGKEIAAKCCGVPLAIKTIAGMLYFKDSESEWLLFKDKELLAIDVYMNDILPILKLSYNHLPPHYKHCFAYCSLFPKDYKIPVDKMIQLWRAQGYVRSASSNECLQDIGFGYFTDLFRLSFFQDIEKDDFGNIVYCKMHDLMHDLAVSVAGDNPASHSGTVCIQEKTRHVSIWGDSTSLSRHVHSMLKGKKIRTVLPLGTEGMTINKKEVDDVFRHLKCLRVTTLSWTRINALPDSVYKLKHLRYLDLSMSYHIKRLPNSLTSLYHLQVLKLQDCMELVELPCNITKLINLTYIDNCSCYKLSHMPRGIGKLIGLENLSEFVVAKDKTICKNSGGLDELHSLNNLRGELSVMNLRHVKNAASEFTEARLSLKQKLQKLNLHWGIYEDENENVSASDVAIEEMGMEELCPHPNLKELEVWFYRGVKPPSWLPSVTNLVSVSFRICRYIQRLPPLDKLPLLKKLDVGDSPELERIEVENGGESPLFFPALTDLTLYNCCKLKGFERRTPLSAEELPFFPHLSQLQITECQELDYLPLFPELEKLISDGDGMRSLMKMLRNSASESTSTPFSTLSRLQYLEIPSTGDSLEKEWLQHLPNSLQHLRFESCTFKSVFSDDEKDDDGVHWQSLKALRSIGFEGMENLVDLPKGLQFATALQRLDISNCPSLKRIPEWMPKLTGLQHLSIYFTPQLEERCNNNLAEDWPKISHIPNIEICAPNEHIQRNGCYLL